MHQCPKCQSTEVSMHREYPDKIDYEFSKPIPYKTHLFCMACHYAWEEIC